MALTPTPPPTLPADNLPAPFVIAAFVINALILFTPTFGKWVEGWLRRRKPALDLQAQELDNDVRQAQAMQETLKAANQAIENYNLVLGRLLQLEAQQLTNVERIRILEEEDRKKTAQIDELTKDKFKLQTENASLSERVKVLEDTLRLHDIQIP